MKPINRKGIAILRLPLLKLLAGLILTASLFVSCGGGNYRRIKNGNATKEVYDPKPKDLDTRYSKVAHKKNEIWVEGYRDEKTGDWIYGHWSSAPKSKKDISKYRVKFMPPKQKAKNIKTEIAKKPEHSEKSSSKIKDKPETEKTTALKINISNKSPMALTPLYISTVGLVNKDPVTIVLTNKSGYSNTFKPVRIQDDGTLVIATPIYIDPETGKTHSLNVSLIVTQGNISTRPVNIHIRDIPQLKFYGERLGAISKEFYRFQVDTLTQKQEGIAAIQQHFGNSMNTSAMQSEISIQLEEARINLKATELIIGNNSLAIPWVTDKNSEKFYFDKSSLELQDRLIGMYLIQMLKHQRYKIPNLSLNNENQNQIAAIQLVSRKMNIKSASQYLWEHSERVSLTKIQYSNVVPDSMPANLYGKEMFSVGEPVLLVANTRTRPRKSRKSSPSNNAQSANKSKKSSPSKNTPTREQIQNKPYELPAKLKFIISAKKLYEAGKTLKDYKNQSGFDLYASLVSGLKSGKEAYESGKLILQQNKFIKKARRVAKSAIKFTPYDRAYKVVNIINSSMFLYTAHRQWDFVRDICAKHTFDECKESLDNLEEKQKSLLADLATLNPLSSIGITILEIGADFSARVSEQYSGSLTASGQLFYLPSKKCSWNVNITGKVTITVDVKNGEVSAHSGSTDAVETWTGTGTCGNIRTNCRVLAGFMKAPNVEFDLACNTGGRFKGVLSGRTIGGKIEFKPHDSTVRGSLPQGSLTLTQE